MKNIYVVLAVVLIAGLGGVYLMKKGPSVDTEEAAELKMEKSTEKPVEKTNNFTLEEIAKHSTETDCWMAVNDGVYDVSEFVSKHPGGKAILGGCGKDATTLFNERPTNNKGPHPEKALEELKNWYIGKLSK